MQRKLQFRSFKNWFFCTIIAGARFSSLRRFQIYSNYMLEMRWQPVPSPRAVVPVRISYVSYIFHILLYLPHFVSTCPRSSDIIPYLFRTYILCTRQDSPQLFVYQTAEVSSLLYCTLPLLIQYLAVSHLGTSIHQSFVYQTAEPYHI